MDAKTPRRGSWTWLGTDDIDVVNADHRFIGCHRARPAGHTRASPDIRHDPDLPPINQVGSGIRIPADDRRGPMKRSKFSEEQIVYALRQAESGTPIGDL
jgi:hypothetical protein